LVAGLQAIYIRRSKAAVNEPATSPWSNHLASQKGLCCSFADGYVVEDADWASENGHYRVRVPKAAGSKDMIWVEVPDEAVITEPNKAGRTMVWPLYGFDSVSIRCFMPGSMI
jgi:hypothetical protein